MLNRNQLMALKTAKLGKLAGFRYAQSVELTRFETRAGLYTADGEYTDIEPVWSEIRVGESWPCRRDVARWFRREVVIPAEMEGARAVLELDFGGEGVVSVNGKTVSALSSHRDPGHKEMRTRVFLSAAARAGERYEIVAECGLNYGDAGADTELLYPIRRAELCAVDPAAEKFYYDMTALFEGMQAVGGNVFGSYRKNLPMVPNEMYEMLLDFNKNDALYNKLYRVFCEALDAAETSFGRDAYIASLPRAMAIYEEGMASIPRAAGVTLWSVGNSHLDTAWLWPVKETVRKCARTFSSALELMERYPDYHFAQSQIQLYEYTKKHYPALFERIRQRVAEGRWEIVGNGWVESDTNVPSGESLVRQLLYGRKFCLREFGRDSKIFWMPDVFGYTWALPQILRRSGMEYFYTCKLNSNEINRFPHTLFNWQGTDGTMIPTYVQKISYTSDMNPFFMHYAWWDFDEKDVTQDVMFAYGFGDGGGGPSEKMQEFADRYADFPGLSAVRQCTAQDYFNHVEHTVRDRLPVYRDELYYENHRGTYTTHGKFKLYNRKCEILYRQTEMAASFAGFVCGLPYPGELLEENWKLILLNQFHDILPGSSIREVYEVAEREYEKVLADGRAMQRDALSALCARIDVSGTSAAVFNFLSVARRELVTLLLPEPAGITDAAGNAVPCEIKTGAGGASVSFYAELPPMGWAVYRIGGAPTLAESAVTVTAERMENRYYVLRLDGRGNLLSVYDKALGREILAPDMNAGGNTVYANTLIVADDQPDAWNIDMEYLHTQRVIAPACCTVSEAGPLRGALEVDYRYGASRITQRIVLYADRPRIDFLTHVDWKEQCKLLKAAFSVDVNARESTSEIAYGAIRRPTHRNTSYDLAKFEIAAHRFVDLSNEGYGVALLNNGKYGHDIYGNVMRITLLRSPVAPDPMCDKYEQDFCYALLPHAESWERAGVAAEGHMLNTPPETVQFEGQSGSLAPVCSMYRVSCPDVFIDCIKEAEDGHGCILRVYEACGARRSCVALALPAEAAEVIECNLMETDEQPLSCNKAGFVFDIKPFEVKTFRILYK